MKKDKILYLPGFSPFKTNGGGNQRSFFLLKALSQIFNVDVVVDFEECTQSDLLAMEGEVNLLDIQQDKSAHYFDRSIRKISLTLNRYSPHRLMPTNVWRYRKIHELIKRNNYKYVITRYLAMLTYHKLYKLQNLIVDIDDIPYQKLESTLRLEHNTLTSADSERIDSMKVITHTLANKTLCTFLPDCSDVKAFPNSFYLPNIPLPAAKLYDRKCGNKIIFVGSMTQDMNYKGVDLFLHSVWPVIKNSFPEIEFHIIGRGTPEEYKIRWNEKPGVVIRGFVDDIDWEYSTSLAAVAPIYSGAGTNIKVLESLAHGCPMVVTPFAMRGFESTIIDGKHILIAKDDKEFISSLSKLITNNNLNEFLSEQGKIVVNKEYSFERFCDCLKEGLNSICP